MGKLGGRLLSKGTWKGIMGPRKVIASFNMNLLDTEDERRRKAESDGMEIDVEEKRERSILRWIHMRCWELRIRGMRMGLRT